MGASSNEFSSVAILEMISFLSNKLKFQFMPETTLRKLQVVAFTFNAFLLGHTFLGTSLNRIVLSSDLAWG